MIPLRRIHAHGFQCLANAHAIANGWIVSRNYDLNGYKRVYHAHIRKTGGASLNHIFLAVKRADTPAAYEELAASRSHMRCWGLVILDGTSR